VRRTARLQICIKSGSHICKSTLHTVYETIACLCNGIFHAPCFLIPAPPPMRRLFHVQRRLCGKTRVSVLQLVTDCLTIVSVVSMQKTSDIDKRRLELVGRPERRTGWPTACTTLHARHAVKKLTIACSILLSIATALAPLQHTTKTCQNTPLSYSVHVYAFIGYPSNTRST